MANRALAAKRIKAERQAREYAVEQSLEQARDARRSTKPVDRACADKLAAVYDGKVTRRRRHRPLLSQSEYGQAFEEARADRALASVLTTIRNTYGDRDRPSLTGKWAHRTGEVRLMYNVGMGGWRDAPGWPGNTYREAVEWTASHPGQWRYEFVTITRSTPPQPLWVDGCPDMME